MKAYRDLKIHHLVRKCRHLVVEAEPVLARVLRREDKVPLSFFLAIHDFPVIRSYDLIINIEGAAGLDLVETDQSVSKHVHCLAKPQGGLAGGTVERTAK